MELIRNAAHTVRDFCRGNPELVAFTGAMTLVGVTTLEVLALVPQQPDQPHIIYDCGEPLPAVEEPSPTAFPAQWSWPIAQAEEESEPKVIHPTIVVEEAASAQEEEPRHHRRRHHRRWR